MKQRWIKVNCSRLFLGLSLYKCEKSIEIETCLRVELEIPLGFNNWGYYCYWWFLLQTQTFSWIRFLAIPSTNGQYRVTEWVSRGMRSLSRILLWKSDPDNDRAVLIFIGCCEWMAESDKHIKWRHTHSVQLNPRDQGQEKETGEGGQWGVPEEILFSLLLNTELVFMAM